MSCTKLTHRLVIVEVFEATVRNIYRPGPCQYRYAHFLSIDVLAFNDGYRVVVHICSEPFPCSIASFVIDEHYVFVYNLQNVLRKWFTFNRIHFNFHFS